MVRAIILLLTAILVSGCDAWIDQESAALPDAADLTAMPTPVLIVLTTPTVEPTATSQPEQFVPVIVNTPASKPPSLPYMAPLETPTSIPNLNVPQARVQILRPGPLSKVISPFRMQFFVFAREASNLRVDLLGEDGRVLAQIVRQEPLNSSQKLNYQYRIFYNITTVSELGRLQISLDDFFGRTIASGSVNLILLSEGSNQTNPPGDLLEPIYIQAPGPNQAYTGGKITIAGMARRSSDRQLIAELITDDGRILDSQTVDCGPFQGGAYVPFTADLTYQVNGETYAIIVVREPAERIPGNQALSSQRITIAP